jgi:hypothetical protein
MLVTIELSEKSAKRRKFKQKLRTNWEFHQWKSQKQFCMSFARQSKASFDMTNPWQMQCLPKSLLVPPKFPYVTNRSPKLPTYSSILLPWDCSLVVMSRDGVSYLIIATKLIQNRGYVYSISLDFLDNSNDMFVFYFLAP